LINQIIQTFGFAQRKSQRLGEKRNLTRSVNPTKRQSFIRRLSKRPEKKGDVSFLDIPGNRIAEKLVMFHTAEVLIASDEPPCCML
jgi:hypothetical protein